jgi:hypothetical protein
MKFPKILSEREMQQFLKECELVDCCIEWTEQIEGTEYPPLMLVEGNWCTGPYAQYHLGAHGYWVNTTGITWNKEAQKFADDHEIPEDSD